MSDLKLALVISAIDKSPAVFNSMAKNAQRGIASVQQAIGKIDGVTGAIGRGVAGLGLGIGIAETARSVIEASESIEQYGYSAGQTEEEVERLKKTIYETAIAGRVSSDALKDGLVAAGRTGGASIGDAAGNAKVLAIQLALGRGDAASLGNILGRFGENGIAGPAQVARAFALLNEEIRGSGVAIQDVTPTIGQMMAVYGHAGHGGIEGLREIGAVIGTIGKTGGRKRESQSDVTTLIGYLSSQQSAMEFAGKTGINPWDAQKNQSISLTDFITKIGEKYQQPGGRWIVENALGSELARGLSSVFNDLKKNGAASDFQSRLAMPGNSKADEEAARDIASGPIGAWNAAIGQVKSVFDWGLDRLKPLFGFIGDHPKIAGGALAAVSFGGLVGGAKALSSASGILGTAFKVVRGTVMGILNPLGLVTGAIGLLRSGVAGLALRGAVMLARSFPLASEAVLAFGAAIETGGAIGGARMLMGAMGLLKGGIGAAAIAVRAGLTGALAAGGEALAVFGGIIEATPIGWVVTGIAAIAAGAYLLYRNWSAIGRWWHKLWFGAADDADAAQKRILGAASFSPGAIGAADARGGKKQSGWQGVFPMAKNAMRWMSGAETKDRSAEALAYFQSKGWSAAQSAGIVANLSRESRLNDTASGDKGKAYGIAQWHSDRSKALAAHFSKPINQMGFTEQLAAVDYELRQGAEQRAGSRIAQDGTARAAGEDASRFYERPGDAKGEAAARGSLAEQLMRGMAQAGQAAKAQIAIRIDGLPDGARAKVKSESVDIDFGFGRHMAPAQ